MASRASNRADALTSLEIGELLDDLTKKLDRCKVMFEQYFLGIQKLPPNSLQKDLERNIRKLTQMHITNTGLRFRFSTLSQKFGSYNTYWKRTMRQIENGSYLRDIARVGRKAVRTGEDIPEELLAKMPKRMRERIMKDRAAVAKRREREKSREVAAKTSGKVRDNKKSNVHSLDDADLLEDMDLDAIFSSMTDAPSVPSASAPSAPAKPPEGKARTKREGTGDTDVNQLFEGVFSDEPTIEDDPRPPPKAAPTPITPPRPRKPAPRQPVPRAASRPARKPLSPPVKPPPGMSPNEAQSLYKSYKKARELVGEDTSGLSYNKLMRSLNKQAPKILEQHKAKGVSFNVVVKGDRVVLKAKPKKE